MDLCMAVCAGYVLCRLVVSWPGWRNRMWKCTHVRFRMALQTECIDVADIEQPRILGSMRRVAACAAFRLDDRMLINKRTCCFRMAPGAGSVLVSGGLELLIFERPMRIMAVAAGH